MSFLQNLIERGTRTLAASAGRVARVETLDLEEIVEFEPAAAAAASRVAPAGLAVSAASVAALAAVPAAVVTAAPAVGPASTVAVVPAVGPVPAVASVASGAAIEPVALARPGIVTQAAPPPSRRMPEASPQPEKTLRKAGLPTVTTGSVAAPPAGRHADALSTGEEVTERKTSQPPAPARHAAFPASSQAPLRDAGIRSVEPVVPVTRAVDPLPPQSAAPESSVSTASEHWRDLGQRLLSTHPPAAGPKQTVQALDDDDDGKDDADLVVESLEVQVVALEPVTRRHAVGATAAWDPAVRYYVERW